MMKIFQPLPCELEDLATNVVDSAYQVHVGLGPGLLESVYETCLVHELRKRNVATETQVTISVVYDGLRLEAGLRIDLLIDKKLIVEIKAVEQMNRIYKAQVMTYQTDGVKVGFADQFQRAVDQEWN